MRKYYPALIGWSIGMALSVFTVKINPTFWLVQLGALGLILLFVKVFTR